MKYFYLLSFFFLFFRFGFAQEPGIQKSFEPENPFEAFGHDETKIATLSQGKYAEFHDDKGIVKVGSFLYNTRSKKIVDILEREETKYTETKETEITSRFMSIDPLFKEYPHYSPYSFSGNKVIAFRELEGLEEMIATFNYNINQPNLLSVTGEQIEMFIVSKALDKAGDDLSYSIVFTDLKPDKPTTPIGKNSFENVQNNAYLIDGTPLKASNKSINQVARLDWITGTAEIFKQSVTVFDAATWIDADKGEINGNAILSSSISSMAEVLGGSGSGFAVGLLLATSESYIAGNKAEQDEIIFNSIFNGSTPLKEAKSLISIFKGVEIREFAPNTLNQYLSGNIMDLGELTKFDLENGDYSNGAGALMYNIFNNGETATIHSIYIPSDEEK